MLTLEQFLDQYEHGIYASYKLTSESQKDFLEALKRNNINFAVHPEEFHVTVVYSRRHVSALHGYPFPNVKATTTGIELFGPESDIKVVTLESPELQSIVASLKHLGVTSDYPEYKPHITIGGEPKPDERLDMPLELELEFHQVEPLKEDITMMVV